MSMNEDINNDSFNEKKSYYKDENVACSSNGVAHTNGTLSSPDPYEDLSEFYLNHPCAVNKAYQPPVADVKMEDDNMSDEDTKDFVEVKVEPFIRPSLRDDAPLASILHPDLDYVDPRLFFSNYRQNKILRFSRLFEENIRPACRADLWWTSKTFHKKQKKNAPAVVQEIHDVKPDRKKIKLEIIEKPDPQSLAMDQESTLMKPLTKAEARENNKKQHEQEQEDMVQPWRIGPAKIWYDMMNVPSTSSSVDYGFKVRMSPMNKILPSSTTTSQSKDVSNLVVEQVDKRCGTDDDHLLPFQMIEWERGIILDGDDVRQSLLDELTSEKFPSCGWIPTQYTRSYEHFIYAVNSDGGFEKMFDPNMVSSTLSLSTKNDVEIEFKPTPTHSIFPSAPSELDLHQWENDIIWDADNMPENPEPITLMVDVNEDPLIYGMPEDRRGEDGIDGKPFDRKDHQFTKKSKMILGQVQQRQKQEEEEQMESSLAQFTDKDPFNLSNDDYYQPKTVNKTMSGNAMLIQHSTPAQNIHRLFFPTHLSALKMRYLHRLQLSPRILRMFPTTYFTTIQTCTRHMMKVNEAREKMKTAEGGGDIFFMRDVADLTGKDGDLMIIEYSEEHPPVLSQPGMAGKIKNYYKRRPGNDVEPNFDYGEMAFSHQVPFLGQLQPGQALQSIENNIYRAPIYGHTTRPVDYLLIREKNSWYIRRCPSLFVAGQQCPLYEVPSPNSKRATTFVRDFLLSFIYRLFWASEHNPRRLKMEDIKFAFPHHAESSVRKRLKQCSQFTRLGQGQDQSFWILRPEFRLPTKEEVLAMITPEMCCAQYSMWSAEQRLKDAGYGEKYFFTPENENDSGDEVTIEDEIKCAPWNTTRTFLSSQRDKCLLDQTGIADPTGCGQGFSYVRVSQKPQREDAPPVQKKLVTGTNADLRKLPLKEAKEICRDYGVKEEEINSLTRWEIIDVIRTLSTQAAKAKDGEMSGMARFARGNTRFNSADMQEKYRKHCQRIFDLQNQTLANPEQLSTDDDGSSAEDSDNEELANRLENMLQANKGNKHISLTEKARMEFESEEKERQDLKRMIHGDCIRTDGGNTKEATAEEKKNASKIGEDVAMSASKISGITANQKLKISRTIRNVDGTETTRVEIVTRPQLIEAYTRMRMTRDDAFIQVYAQMDEQYKEMKRKQKRRLQDQLRRIKKNEQKANVPDKKPEKKHQPEKPLKPSLVKMRCSACHGTGHMKTNRNCPLYGKEVAGLANLSGPSDVEETSSVEASEMVQVEGVRMKINMKALLNVTGGATPLTGSAKKAKSSASRSDSASIDHSHSPAIRHDYDDNEVDDFSMLRTTQRSNIASAKRRTSNMPEEDYLVGPIKSVHRLRADPKVTMSTFLTEIITELKTLPGADHHLLPVNAKKVPDYYHIIKEPMDLQKIKNKIGEHKYDLRKDFLLDVKKMLDNSRLYNGDNSIITEAANQMFELACKRVIEKEDKFINLEKQINPLLDDDDIVGFSHLLGEIVQKCKNVPKSAIFHTKVDIKKVPMYYDRIKRPIDLGQIELNTKNRIYKTVASFRADIEQIYKNSEQFNGSVSIYTKKAAEVLEVADRELAQQKIQLAELEANITGVPLSTLLEQPQPHAQQSSDEPMDENEPSPVKLQEVVDESSVDVSEQMMSEEQDDSEMHDPDLDQDMDIMWTEDGVDMTDSKMASAGQVINDLAMSDSDEEDHLDDVRRPTEHDNMLNDF